MEHKVTFARLGACATSISAAMLAVPAAADVMEVGEEGARWVTGDAAGGLVNAAPAATSATTATPQLPRHEGGEARGDDGDADRGDVDRVDVDRVDVDRDGDVRGDLVIPEEAVARPREHARAIPAKYAQKVAELSERFDLSASLIEALVWQESRWRESARSHAGARGLAQLMPATARELGVDPDDPMQNLEGGARYLRQQLDRFGGDLEKALAAYNAGPSRVIRAGGIPRIRETQQFVAAIMGRLGRYSRQ